MVSDAPRLRSLPWTLALRGAGMCGRSTTAAGRGAPGITSSRNLGSRTPRRKRSKPQSENLSESPRRPERPTSKNVSFPHPTILAHTGIPSPDAIPETTIARRGGHRSERSGCAPCGALDPGEAIAAAESWRPARNRRRPVILGLCDEPCHAPRSTRNWQRTPQPFGSRHPHGATRRVRPSAEPVAGGLSAHSAAPPSPWPADAHEDRRSPAWCS